MINLKLELFNQKKNLNLDTQEEIYQIIDEHFKSCDLASEKRIIESLNDKLSKYTYDDDVKSLLENLNNDIQSYEILYNLKDMYKLIEQKNQGMIYRQTLNVLLEIINVEDDSDRMVKIMNELALHDWVPEVKTFIHNLTTEPEKRENLLSGGNAQSVYTIMETIDNGHLAYVNDSWFLLNDECIEKTLLENHIADEDKLREIRTLQQAVSMADISENRIDFRINENLIIGLSVKNKGEFFINEDKANGETTLENLFASPIISVVNRAYYPIIESVMKNLDKFIELDIVKEVTNVSNPYLKIFAFNHANNIYMYRTDSRQGNSLFKYESATEIINDVKNELQYDMSYFFENYLNDEQKKQVVLEDKVREIKLNLDEVDDNIEKVKSNITMLGESEILSNALDILNDRKKELSSELIVVEEILYNERAVS